MKKIFYSLLLIFCSVFAYSQTVTLPSGATARASQAYTKNDSVYFQLGPYGSVRVPVYQDVQYKTVQKLVDRNAIPAIFRKKGMLVFVVDSIKHYVLTTGITNVDWTELSAGDPQEIIAGGSITSIPTIGYNPGSNITPGAFITSSFYQSQVPTATLTGGIQQELLTGGFNLSATLNWSASRQAATQNLSTIVVASVNQTFVNPGAPGTVSGTQVVSYPRNLTTNYSNVVTTADGKTATATTTFTFLPKRYWGRSSTNTPTASDLIAALGGGSELSNVKAKGLFSVTASGTNYVFYAYPSSLGDLTSLTIGGFESLGTFTKNVTSITNASGYIQNYNIYVSNNTFSATATNIVTN